MGKYRIVGLAVWLLGAAALVPVAPAAAASGSSFTGTFAGDADQKEFFFSVTSPQTVTIRTYSYAGGTNQAGTAIPAGGLNPTLSLFDDANGLLIGINQDGGCGLVGQDPVTSSCWDSYLSASLPAGNYRVVLTQSSNLPAGPALSNSFIYNPGNILNSSTTNAADSAATYTGGSVFTQPPDSAPPGFWDYYPNQRTSFYAVDILGVTGVAPAVSTSATLPFGITGSAYSPLTLTVQTGPGVSYTWTPPASGLPPGISLSTSGVLSGTPTSSGSYTFTAMAADGVQAVQQAETIIIYNPLSITTSVLPNGLRGQSYGPVQFTASGGSGSDTWSSTGLAAGLTLSPSGVLSGTTPSSVAQFSVTATDTVTGQTATMMYSITVSVPALQISGGSLPETALGSVVSASFGASGGTPPYTFSSPNLPAGLTIGASSGALNGVPTFAGNYSFTVNVADSGGQSSSTIAGISVLGLVSTSVPQASVSAAYSFTFSAAGGRGVYTFSASGVPAGLTLSPAGVLSGTPTSAGKTTFTVQVSDGFVTASAMVTITIALPQPLAVPGGSLTNGQVQVSYSSILTATGGTSPYSWTLLGGTLPNGLSLSSTGQITGTPTLPTTFSFTAQATDVTGAMVSGSFTITIAPAPLTLISGYGLPQGFVSSNYPQQIFSAAGGLQPYTFSVSSGSLPPGLSLSDGLIAGTPTTAGTFPFTLTLTDATGKSIGLSLSIVVSPAQADLLLSDTFLNFSIQTGTAAVPSGSGANVTVQSSIVTTVLNYSYSLTPAVPWLAVTGGTVTPGSLGVALTNSALSLAASPSPYQTSVNITCIAPSPCAGQTQTVSVSLTVSSPSPELSLTSTLLSFSSTTASPATSSLPLGIQNVGGGTLGISSVTSARNWITVSGVPGSVASGSAVPFTVTANPLGLPAGYNYSSVTVESSAGSQTVPVVLYISNNSILTLGSAAGQFAVPQGAALSPNTGSFPVTVNGTQSVSWSASVLPGAPWLSLTTGSGTSTTGSAGVVGYTIDPVQAAQLSPGFYYGTIAVASSAVSNSPQNFQVSLRVGPVTSLPVPYLNPAGLLFTPNGPASQTVSVYASSAGNVNYQASAATTDGAAWLSVSPATGTSSASAPGSSSVSVNAAGLAPGGYTGLVSYAFSAAAVRSVNVTLIVDVTGALIETSAATPACTPTKLVPTQLGLVSNFSQIQGLPVALQVLLTDNCGVPVSNAMVGATFSNGDAPLPLNPVDNVSGIYSATWVPLGVSPQVSVTVLATDAGFAPGSSRITGEVPASTAPVLTQNAVLSVYNPLIGGAIAPGGILELYGSNLAAAPVVSSIIPLTTTLGSTSVLIGGVAVPLYYVSPTQINAQAPFELTPGSQYQVVVNVNGALTAPQTITVAPAEPGIAAYQNGQIIAQHLDGTLISETSPAKPGTYVVFYLAGLGATAMPVADGGGSPLSPLANPIATPALTLNGVSEPYQFVGLTPGLVGLYQINFLVPAGTANGDMLLVVSQNGVPSNSVILPVHN